MHRLPQPKGNKEKLKVQEDGKARARAEEKGGVHPQIEEIEVVIAPLVGAQHRAALDLLASREWAHRRGRVPRNGCLSM